MVDSSAEQFNVLAVTMNGNKQNDEGSVALQYSMPGILHFLQTEWARFESDRAQWEIDRAELQAKVAFLQGERKGQENLKCDLVRRIKMLEYALKQERSKYHKLKYGTDLEQGDMIPPNLEKDFKDDRNVNDPSSLYNNNGTWKHGRQLLRQYLQEIGYTDTIIDVRSARIRQMLGLPTRETAADTKAIAVVEPPSGKRLNEIQGNGLNVKKTTASVVGPAITSSQEAIMATFDFLGNDNIEDDEDDDVDAVCDTYNGNDLNQMMNSNRVVNREPQQLPDGSKEGDEGDADTEEALAEFDFLAPENNEEAAAKSQKQKNGTDWDGKDLSPNEEWNVDERLISEMKERYKQERRKDRKTLTGQSPSSTRPSKASLKTMLQNLDNEENMNAAPLRSQESPPNGNINIITGLEEGHGFRDNEEIGNETALGLGELADLSVNNDVDSVTYDLQNSVPGDVHRKIWTPKYTLRSHFDGIRAIAFHPVEEVVITAGEDHVLKLWNLQKSASVKKSALLDVEPIYTLRGHSGPVLSVVMSATGEMCYSGGYDGTICCWNVPNFGVDPYDLYDPNVLQSRLMAHTDAVWGLSMHSSRLHLLSCSADGTVRLWNPDSQTSLLNTFRVDADKGVPTSVDFVREEPSQMVVSYSMSGAFIFDMEQSKPIVTFDYTPVYEENSYEHRINRILSHPTLPITITAHEDRHLRFFDNNSGKVIHSMVAHLDAVTSLAVDQSGLYLLSGSHDCSIRLWNLETKTCVQELTVHRKKFDESIHDVAFHPSKPFFASAGADALAKVFV